MTITSETEATPLCLGRDEWLSDDRDQRERAADACYDCPLMHACYDTALGRGEKFGVWGGIDFTRGTGPTPRQLTGSEITRLESLRTRGVGRRAIATSLGVPENLVRRWITSHPRPEVDNIYRGHRVDPTFIARVVELHNAGLSTPAIMERLGCTEAQARHARRCAERNGQQLRAATTAHTKTRIVTGFEADVVTMRDQQGLTFIEIAQRTGIPLGSINRVYKRTKAEQEQAA